MGDGYTDYELFKEGIASSFVAFAEHKARPSVLAVAPIVVQSARELSNLVKNESL